MTHGYRMIYAGIIFGAAVVFPAALKAADAPAQTAPLHGADAMDGKNKPGQDGWSWAPVPRDQAASQSGKTPGNDKTPDKTSDASRPVPNIGNHLSAGQDPGTPTATTSATSAKSTPASTSGAK